MFDLSSNVQMFVSLVTLVSFVATFILIRNKILGVKDFKFKCIFFKVTQDLKFQFLLDFQICLNDFHWKRCLCLTLGEITHFTF